MRQSVTRNAGNARLEGMDALDDGATREAIITALRNAGATFALIHGSTVRGTARPGSDIDICAWWAGDPPPSFDVLVPAGVDLMVPNGAPLELAGRVALDGVILFEDDPAARVGE